MARRSRYDGRRRAAVADCLRECGQSSACASGDAQARNRRAPFARSRPPPAVTTIVNRKHSDRSFGWSCGPTLRVVDATSPCRRDRFRDAGVLGRHRTAGHARHPHLRLYPAHLPADGSGVWFDPGVGSIPGVTAVTQASRAPISGGNRFVPVAIDDAEPPAGEGGEDKRPAAGYSYIAPNYFETLGVPMVSGRRFTVQEAETEAPVVIISEATARRFWPGQDPIGKRLVIGSVNGPAPYPGETAPSSPGSEVIGVVRDVRSLFLNRVDELYLYLPLSQARQWAGTLLVRTSGRASSLVPTLGSAVRRVDPNLPVVLAPLDWMVSFDPYFVISRIGGGFFRLFCALGFFLAWFGGVWVGGFEGLWGEQQK